MHATLDKLLVRIRDGDATPADLAQARELAAHDARLPADLRAAVFRGEDDDAAEAAGLLAILGEDGAFGAALREALTAEADVAVDAGVFAALGERLVDVAGAIRAEAGSADVVDGVLQAAGLATALPVAASVRAESGAAPEIWRALELGASPRPVAAAIVAEAGDADLAGAVMAVLDAPDLPIGRAVRSEAGRVDVVTAVLEEVSLEDAHLPLAEAILAEAGAAEIVDAVDRTLSEEVLAGLLDHELDATTHRLAAQQLMADPGAGLVMTAMADLGRDLRGAVAAEAGPLGSLWTPVAHAIGIEDPEQVEGWDEAVLASAILAEAAGAHAPVADAVMAEVARLERSARDMPLADLEPELLPLPANSARWTWGAAVMAMVALLVVGASQLAPWATPTGGGTSGIVQLEPVEQLTFASASEIVVEDLEYADNVQVFQAEGDDGALIIWVDEEEV